MWCNGCGVVPWLPVSLSVGWLAKGLSGCVCVCRGALCVSYSATYCAS